MNKRLYRIIFNKKRGQLMVVAESAISDGKSTGTTERTGSGDSPYTTTLRPVSFALFVAMGLVSLAVPQAHAQIVAYKAAPAGQQATVLSAGNGVPLVNIRTPSAAGVSRNTFSQFDVQQQGAILNNAHANAKTQLGGWVQGNPWLAAGTARVILNEVVSANPSLIGGYVEVAGDRAQVVIANPAGVTCSGCGFINASRATLTTGAPIMNGGNLQGYRVEGGTIRIEGTGMDASGATQTDLIARAVSVNAGLWANALRISTGVNQVNADNTAVTPSTGGSTPAPAFALDVAALGGMYAGKITLVGTEAGVGVRNAGQIGASAGDVVVTAKGQLINRGTLSSSATTRIDTAAGISNEGMIYAKGDTRLSTQGDIDHTGVIAAQNDVALSATGSGSRIRGSTDAVIGAGLLTDGTLGGNGHLDINANGEAALHGQNVASGDLRIAAGTVDLSGSQTLAVNTNLQATSGDTDLRNAVLTANGTLTASTTQTLRHDGASSSAQQLVLAAHDLSNQHGELIQSGSGATAISLAGILDNTAGKLAVNSRDLGLSAQTILNTNGLVVHAGAGEMRINASTRLDNAGGSLESAGRTVLSVGDLDNRNGVLSTSGNAGLALTATGAVDNRHGEISTGGDITLAAQSLQNAQGQISAGQTLQAGATGAIDNAQGRFVANGNVRVRADGIDNTQGVIGSVSGSADIDAGNLALDNRAGRIEAAQAISLASHALINVDGLVLGRDLAIDSRLQSTDNTRGTISATGTLSLNSGEILNDAGLIQAAGALAINTHGQRLANTNSGSSGIVGQDSVTLNTGELDNNAGFVGAQGALVLNTTTLSNTAGGTLSGAGDLQISGSSLDNRGGQIQAVGDVHAQIGGTVDNRSSLIRAGQILAIGATRIDNRDTQGTDQGIEAASLDLVATDIDNTHGALRADDALTLTSSGTVNNTHGLVSSADTLTIKDTATDKTLAVTNTAGVLIADQMLTIDSASLSNGGRILGVTDIDIKLTADTVQSGEITANRNARVETAGTFTNNHIVQAGNALTVTAATLNNAATGTLKANRTRLTATDSHTLVNRGLIDGAETFIDSITVNNLGTGRIYGDHVAIAATTLTNEAETVAGTTSAPVIAARDRLDIGATTIDNREGAMLFSAGDLALGGALDADHHATGRAGTVNNVGATIEALGKVRIDATQINNRNAGLTTHQVNTGSTSITEYQGSGAATRYLAGTPGVYIYEDESDHLHTPEGNYSSWLAYRYTRTTTETQVLTSAPGEILSGGAMTLGADAVLNDDSRIVAGGTLSATAATIENRETAGERKITDAGTVTSYWRDHEKGRDDTGRSTTDYQPPTTIQTISLGTTVYRAGSTPDGSGTSVASLTLGSVGQNANGASGSAVAPNGVHAVARIVEVNALNGSGPAMVVRSITPNLSLPGSSLYRRSPNPTAHYLIETDPAFASYRTWLTSDYMLKQLSLDPATTQKRLGDGFYEQRLVREQVAQLTGRRFLDGYADDEAQYAGLMNAGVTLARQWNLIPGVALSAEQMAALTTDIVWLVEKDIDLGNGRTGKALVPQVYARVQSTDLSPSGALIAANDIDLNLSGDLINQGTVAGRRVVALTAENIKNLGGRIAGQSVDLTARTDLANLGGSIQASDTLRASAGHDLTVASTTRTQTNARGSRTNLDRVAGLYVTGKNDGSGSGGTLVASAGNDLTLLAAALINSQPTAAGVSASDAASASKGTTLLQAGQDLTLGTVTEASSNHLAWDAKNKRDDAHQSDIGTTIQTTGDLTLSAGHDLTAKAASVTSDEGALVAHASNDLLITAGTAADQVDEAHRHKEKGFLSSKTRTTRDTLDATHALSSTFSGETTELSAGRDLTVQGSNVVATNDTTLTAGRNLTLASATETYAETHFKKTTQSGIFGSGGVGFTIGSKMLSTDQQSTGTTAAASTVGSTSGNVVLKAGETYRQVGSDVIAPSGDTDITAKTVDILEARERNRTTFETKMKQSGLTVAITSPIISAIQTAQQMSEAAKDTKDSRMQLLAAANVGLSAYNTYDAVKTDPKAAGGVGISITVGSSKSSTKSTQTSDTASGSTLVAGQDIRIKATGAGKASDITVQGSDLTAGNNVTLKADDEIKLLAAKNESSLERDSKSSSAAIGVAITVGSNGVAMGITANASGGRGTADGSDVTWANTHIDAGHTLLLESGGDTTLKGAVASADHVVADIGGNLNIESLQDTSTYRSKDQSIGGSVTVGAGFAGSVNVGQSKINSDYASVIEQSGIKAGDGGFQIDVEGNTDLKGAVISSSDTAVADSRNALATSTLTVSDIQNRAEYEGESFNIGGGYSTSGSGVGKDQKGNADTGSGVPGSTLPSLDGFSATPPIAVSASGSANSVTRSGISSAVIEITDSKKQEEITGKDAATTVASLNRDVATGQDTTNALQPIFDEKEIQAGFAITSAFAREAGTFLENRAKEANAVKAQAEQAEKLAKDPAANLSDEQRQALLDQAKTLRTEAQTISDNWGAGGTYRQITSALVAAVSGNVSATSSEFARNMVINYVQQQGASYIGKLVADGTLIEGSPLHAALHSIVACAGAAASSQSCGSGALGAAASSLLTGLFSDTNPNETQAAREAKRNLIASLVTGIAAVSGADASTATNSATAAVDNNWLATQQIVQMKKELTEAKGALEVLKVSGKWAYISGKQDVLTAAGVGKGLADSGISDVKGLAEFLSDPIAGLDGLKQIITSADAREQLGDSVFRELDAKIDRMKTALEQGGDQNAEQLGEDLGALIWQVGTVVTGAGAVAKSGVALAKVGINLGTKGLEAMKLAGTLVKAEGIAAVAGEIRGFRSAESLNGLMGAYKLEPAWKAGTQVAETTLKPGTKVQMVVDKAAFEALQRGEMNYVGNWATFDNVSSQSFARNGLAITKGFKEDVGYVVELEITKPLNAQIGIVGPQSGAAGGANQVNFMFPRREGGEFFKLISGKALP